MIGRYIAAALLGVALVAGTAPVWAQAGVSEASGEVVDREGNPIQGAIVRFTPRGNPTKGYKSKSNKKGRYYIPGLFTPQENDTWIVEVEYEGYVLYEGTVETRTVNKTLIIPSEKQRAKDGKVQDFRIPKLGMAKVDLVLADAAKLAQEGQQQTMAVAVAASGAAASGEAASAQPKKDPWLEATRLANAGSYEESIPLFAEAVEDDPEALERREVYAKVLAHLERYDEASAELDALLAQNPESVDARLLQSQIRIKQGDFDQALASLEAAREVAPDDMRVYEQMAWVAGEQGDLDSQITSYEAMAELAPSNAQSWVSLGDLYAKSGRMKDSEAAYQKVIDLDPDNAYRTYYNLAVFNLNRDNAGEADRKRAIDALRRAIEIKPDYAQAYKELGLALIGLGDRAGAKQALQKYIALKPSAPDAAQMRAIVGSLG